MGKENIFAGDFVLARLFNRAAKRGRNRAALLCRDIEPRVQRRFARKRIVASAERRAYSALDRHIRAHRCIIGRKAHFIRLDIGLGRAFAEAFSVALRIAFVICERACGFKHKAGGALYFSPRLAGIHAVAHDGFIAVFKRLKISGRKLTNTEQQAKHRGADDRLEQYQSGYGVSALLAFFGRLRIEPQLSAVFPARHASVFRIHKSASQKAVV